jgi:hypothetical protein
MGARGARKRELLVMDGVPPDRSPERTRLSAGLWGLLGE